MTENTSSLSVSWNDLFLQLPCWGLILSPLWGSACPPSTLSALLVHVLRERCPWSAAVGWAPGLILGDSAERPPLPGVSSYTWPLLGRKVTFSFPPDFWVIISLIFLSGKAVLVHGPLSSPVRAQVSLRQPHICAAEWGLSDGPHLKDGEVGQMLRFHKVSPRTGVQGWPLEGGKSCMWPSVPEVIAKGLGPSHSWNLKVGRNHLV